jgi:hypothetical protein
MATPRPRRVVKVQKEERPEQKIDALDTLAEFCWHYPAYTLRMARRVPFKHVKIMLKRAKQLEAARYYELALIAQAPHTEKGKGVGELLSRYEAIISDGK